jgi:large subunit ribosomal protein L7/L12
MAEEEKNKQEETKENKQADEKPEKAEDKSEPETKEEPSKEAKQASEAPKEAPKQVQDTPSEEKETAKAPEPKKEVKVSGKLADIIKNIEGLSVLELADLVKALEEKFGVSAAAPVAVAAGAPAGGAESEQEEGQTTFNVVLADAGANKISVIKAVRELVPTLGLKEAKDLVDSAPKQVLEGAGKDAANEAKQKLEAAGGKVELK